MNKVNFKKVVCGVSLGTVMVLGSMSSAFASDINHPAAQDKTVQIHQQKPDPKPAPQPKQQPPHHVKLLTEEQAKDIALKQYKGVVKDIQLTKENGTDIYVIIIHGHDGKDHTVKLNAVFR